MSVRNAQQRAQRLLAETRDEVRRADAKAMNCLQAVGAGGFAVLALLSGAETRDWRWWGHRRVGACRAVPGQCDGPPAARRWPGRGGDVLRAHLAAAPAKCTEPPTSTVRSSPAAPAGRTRPWPRSGTASLGPAPQSIPSSSASRLWASWSTPPDRRATYPRRRGREGPRTLCRQVKRAPSAGDPSAHRLTGSINSSSVNRLECSPCAGLARRCRRGVASGRGGLRGRRRRLFFGV
jgi:hypothetical protein